MEKNPKFICLNDDKNINSIVNDLVIELMNEFYLTLLPNPSSFELDYSNSNSSNNNEVSLTPEMKEFEFNKRAMKFFLSKFDYYQENLPTTASKWIPSNRT